MLSYKLVSFFVLSIIVISTAKVIKKREISSDAYLRVIGPVVKPEEAHLFKYQVALQINCSQKCGGTIISDRLIITAAHCVAYKTPRNVTVRADVLDVQNDEGGQTVEVFLAKIHRNYIGSIDHHDLAILLLQDKLDLSILTVAKLPELRHNYTGEIVEVSGWGRSANLTHASFEVTNPIPECWEQEHILCASPVIEGTNTFFGDSGGPLVLRQGSEYVLVGTVSGFMGGQPVFVNNANLRRWIDEAVAELHYFENTIEHFRTQLPKSECSK